MTTGNERLVLVVDDDEGVRDLLTFALKKEGYRVATAQDGEEGLRRINSMRPDLLVLDLMLPRHGGFELLRELQKSERSSTPIVVITGRYTDRHTVELIRLESNVVELLEKPIKVALLLETLRRVLAPRVPADAAEG